MAIQWYPGHMHKAQKEIREVMSQIDLVIEVLDARIPFSSENPLVDQLRQDKPCLKILNKSDLADPEMTRQWLEYFASEHKVKGIPLNQRDPDQVQPITGLCRQMVDWAVDEAKPIRAMIMGIPNVGKSTLINNLAGRTVAKVGNEPAVTKRQQKINLKNGVILSDTPGILWPKLEPPGAGYRLAVTGAVKDTAVDYEELASYAAEYLLRYYPQRLQERYQIETLPQQDWELVELIGIKRGCRRSGGQVDLHKASVILINEIRDGTLGALTFENPAMVAAEKAAYALELERIAAEKEARKKARKKRR